VFSVETGDLPENSLLLRYRESGAFTDCYYVDIDRVVSQAEYIRAFYTTTPFKLERLILKWAVSRPSTDEDVDRLAEARSEEFAAWYVETRCDTQLLLSDYRDRTRSWLMTEPSGSAVGDSTRLYFGSAVVPIQEDKAEERRLENGSGVLLRFHKLYSEILLLSSKHRLLRSTPGSGTVPTPCDRRPNE